MSSDKEITIIDVGPGSMGAVDIVKELPFYEHAGETVLQAIKSSLHPHQASQVCFVDAFSDQPTLGEGLQSGEFLEINFVVQSGSDNR